MAELWMGNVGDDATDEEIKELLVKYGFPPFDEIQRVPGSGSHPAVLLTFHDTEAQALRSLEPRIQHLFWKDRSLNVAVTTTRED
jgi:hypothetical protein